MSASPLRALTIWAADRHQMKLARGPFAAGELNFIAAPCFQVNNLFFQTIF
jgi:hypothetical protein